MPDSLESVVFSPISTRTATLVVVRTLDAFGLQVDSRMQEHRLGFGVAPAYRVAQPFSPDDGWVVEPIGGRLVTDDSSNDPDTLPILPSYRAWSAGSRATHGAALLGQVPTGRYLVVRSSREPFVAQRVLLGNEYVPAAPFMRVLKEDKPVYSCIIGADRNRPADLSQPLLGLAVLNYVGESWMQGVIFFQCTTNATGLPTLPDQRDLILIIPLEGGLVVDNMGFFSADDERKSKAKWRDDLGPKFAGWCSG